MQGSDANLYMVTVSDGLTSVSSRAAHLSVEEGTDDPLMMFVQGPRQDYCFRNGVTYWIGPGVELYGTTTLRGNTVLKFDWYHYTNSSLVVKGSLVTDTQPLAPAILTSLADNSQGQVLWWDYSWPEPAANGVPYLNLDAASSSVISNLRFCFADLGVTTPVSPRELDVWDCQFYQCNIAIANQVWGFGARDILHNVLFANCGAAIGAASNSVEIVAEHVTADVTSFWVAPSPPYKVALTNSIILGTLGESTIAFTQQVALNPDRTNFQSAALGNYYLAPGSPLHQAGTPSISPTLAAEFAHKTTCAPLALAPYLQISGHLTLSPQVPRYTNGAPDLGYAYQALDYTVARLTVAGGTVQVLPGSAIAVRNEYVPAQNWFTETGFLVQEGSAVVSRGTPNEPIIFTTARLVQETPATELSVALVEEGSRYYVRTFVPDYEPNEQGSPAPTLDFRFCEFYLPPQDYHVWAGCSGDYRWLASPDSSVYWTLRDCSLHGGQLCLGESEWVDWWPYDKEFVFSRGAVAWNNCLFDQVSITLSPSWNWWNGVTNCDLAFQASNNLFRGGLPLYLEPTPASAGNWVLKDNLFDKVEFWQDTTQPLDRDHNGYWPLLASELRYSDTANRLLPTNSFSDQVLGSAPPYQVGPFGEYYLPYSTPLFGAGSRSAADAGLFHYSTRVDQIKEGEESSGHMVNIGLHYVATANSAAYLPKDTDGDGIPDYVENWHGDGRYDLHTDTETAWTSAWTVAGIYDPTNAVYDDIDLSGSGLVGRIKKALGLQPLDPSNPLAASQVTTGEEPGFATFEVQVSYDAVTNAGTLSLNMNGAPVTLQECTRATNGNCLLSFNVAYDPMGQHYLSAEFRLNSDPGTEYPVVVGSSGLLPFYSSNSLQFFESGSMFDNSGAYLDARLFAANADYRIELYDPSTSSARPIKTITGSTTSGRIQEDWDLTLADGITHYSNAAVQAAFVVTYTNNPGSAATNALKKHLTKAEGSLSEAGVNMDVVYFRTATNDAWGPAYAKGGAIWDAMQGVVDVLINPMWDYPVYYSDFNRYLPDARGEYPGYITKRVRTTNDPVNLPTVLNTLLPDMTNGLTKQIYIYGHGTNGWMGNNDNTAYITAADVSGALRNTYSKTNLVVQGPYRFVFLDGCATASGPDWRRAYGIFPIDIDSQGQAARNRTGPQAYVGWADVVASGLSRKGYSPLDVIIVQAYARTLQTFYVNWMSGLYSVRECLDAASVRSPNMFPLPVPQNPNFILLLNGQPYTFDHITTSKIYIIGYPGLTVTGRKQSLDGDTKYAAPRTIE